MEKSHTEIAKDFLHELGAIRERIQVLEQELSSLIAKEEEEAVDFTGEEIGLEDEPFEVAPEEMNDELNLF